MYKREEGPRPEAEGALRADLRPLEIVEPQRLHLNVVVGGDDADVSGATVLDVCFCTRGYLAIILSLCISLSLSLSLFIRLCLRRAPSLSLSDSVSLSFPRTLSLSVSVLSPS